MTERRGLWRPSSSFRGFIHNARVERDAAMQRESRTNANGKKWWCYPYRIMLLPTASWGC